MDLARIKSELVGLEAHLKVEEIADLANFERDGRCLNVSISARFVRAARNAKMWKPKGMLTAIKNAQYGFSQEAARITGGVDGVFLVDRDYSPSNEMTRRLYSGFLNKPDPLVSQISGWLDWNSDRLKGGDSFRTTPGY